MKRTLKRSGRQGHAVSAPCLPGRRNKKADSGKSSTFSFRSRAADHPASILDSRLRGNDLLFPPLFSFFLSLLFSPSPPHPLSFPAPPSRPLAVLSHPHPAPRKKRLTPPGLECTGNASFILGD